MEWAYWQLEKGERRGKCCVCYSLDGLGDVDVDGAGVGDRQSREVPPADVVVVVDDPHHHADPEDDL